MLSSQKKRKAALIANTRRTVADDDREDNEKSHASLKIVHQVPNRGDLMNHDAPFITIYANRRVFLFHGGNVPQQTRSEFQKTTPPRSTLYSINRIRRSWGQQCSLLHPTTLLAGSELVLKCLCTRSCSLSAVKWNKMYSLSTQWE